MEGITGVIKELCVALKKSSVLKLPYVLRCIAAGVIMFTFFCRYWNVLDYIEWGCAPLWGEEIRTFFHKSFTEIIIFGAVCYFVLEKGIRTHVLIPLAIKFDKKDLWFPIWFTLCDGVDLCFSLYFIMFSINELIEFANGVSSMKTIVLYVAIAYVSGIIIRKLYDERCDRWERIIRKYTNYFDSKEQRIPYNADVIYYGKLYQIRLCEIDPEGKKKAWKLISRGDYEGILLEEAVKDKEGKLTLAKLHIRGSVEKD